MQTLDDFGPGMGRKRASKLDPLPVETGTTKTAQVGAPSHSTSTSPADTDPQKYVFDVNGQTHAMEIDPRTSLLDLLREQIGLNGAKKGCDHGQCGACTVHADGRRILSCLTIAAQAAGARLTTIEGVAAVNALHPMQQAFIDHDALQCGYCTPGQIMSAIACVHEGHAGSAHEIREYMSGNLCRCGAYTGIVAAIQAAAPLMQHV